MRRNERHHPKSDSSPDSEPRRNGVIVRWIGPAVILAVSAAMLTWQWRAWPDPFVDFGRELYTPWQLAQGKHLYTDVAYFNGPLSPYLNAVLFRLFGVSLTTLIWANIIFTLTMLLLLYRLLTRVADRFAATVAGVIFAAVFGFGNILIAGNYNFICPYSHELLHGLLLSVIALTLLDLYFRRPKTGYLIAVGLTLGLTFLTKPEIFLALAAAVIFGLIFFALSQSLPLAKILGRLGLVLMAALVPAIIAWALLTRFMPADQAWRCAAGAWSWLGDSRITSLKFYRRSMGLDDPVMQLSKIAIGAAFYAACFLPPWLIARRTPREKWYRDALAWAWAAITLVILSLLAPKIIAHCDDLARPMPLVLMMLLAFAVFTLIKNKKNINLTKNLILRIALILFALVLLAKIILNCRVHHYGFALAMPATLIAVLALVCWAPRHLNSHGRSGIIFQIAAIGVLCVFVGCELWIADFRLGHKNSVVAAGSDAFRADGRGDVINTLLDQIRRHAQPNQTLAVLPEGIMVNYLARRANPTPYINLMPPEIIMFGENNILDSLQKNRPDFIAFIHKDTSEYGPQFFGRDYAQSIYNWVLQNYAPMGQIGSAPFNDDRFGVILLKARR